MRNPDNQVSIDIELIKKAGTTIEELEADGLEPDKITIQQSDVGGKGELNLAFELESEN